MSTKRPNNRTISASQRWQASGLAKPETLQSRIAMLAQLNRRSDLSDLERRICVYLLLERTNSETGLCFVTDAYMAEQLNVTKRGVEKAKASLRAKGILDWHTERQFGKNTVSLYRFLYRERPNASSVSNAEQSFGINEPPFGIKTNAGSVSTTNAGSVSTTRPGTFEHDARQESRRLAQSKLTLSQLFDT